MSKTSWTGAELNAAHEKMMRNWFNQMDTVSAHNLICHHIKTHLVGWRNFWGRRKMKHALNHLHETIA